MCRYPTNVSICASYWLNVVNSVTRNLGIHTFHIISKCPSTNMPTTWCTYVLLHVYCSLHINATLLNKDPTFFMENVPWYFKKLQWFSRNITAFFKSMASIYCWVLTLQTLQYMEFLQVHHLYCHIPNSNPPLMAIHWQLHCYISNQTQIS